MQTVIPLLSIIWAALQCDANSYEYPHVLWSNDLLPLRLRSMGIRKGNGVIFSGKNVWTTSADGGLHGISTQSQANTFSFEPQPLPKHETQCYCTPVMTYSYGSAFVVYSVVDVPIDQEESVTR